MGQMCLHLWCEFRHFIRLRYWEVSTRCCVHFRSVCLATSSLPPILHILPWWLPYVPHRLLLLRQFRPPLHADLCPEVPMALRYVLCHLKRSHVVCNCFVPQLIGLPQNRHVDVPVIACHPNDFNDTHAMGDNPALVSFATGGVKICATRRCDDLGRFLALLLCHAIYTLPPMGHLLRPVQFRPHR